VPQHANEGWWISWNEARILQIETERYRKKQEISAYGVPDKFT